MDFTCVDLYSPEAFQLIAAFLAPRVVLLLLDSLSGRVPSLKPIADGMGTVMGGKKQRFASGDGP